jgi:hypothetical protein
MLDGSRANGDAARITELTKVTEELARRQNAQPFEGLAWTLESVDRGRGSEARRLETAAVSWRIERAVQDASQAVQVCSRGISPASEGGE